MNTKPLTLTEVAKLLETLPTAEAISRPDIQDFVAQVSAAGKGILREKGGEYITEAAIFLMSGTMAELLAEKDLDSIQIAMSMAKHSEMFSLILGYAFVYAVGLAAVEELH